MAKTIVMTDLKVKQITIDYERQAVIATYDMLDASGKAWISSEGTFFLNMPPQTPIYAEDHVTITGYEPYPESWFQLPASYVPGLVSLLNDADAALTSRFLV